mgnify:CR=1 FL=1
MERKSARHQRRTLNESPSEKEGKFESDPKPTQSAFSLNESPSEKEGKWAIQDPPAKVRNPALNESPSEKEGKSYRDNGLAVLVDCPQ